MSQEGNIPIDSKVTGGRLPGRVDPPETIGQTSTPVSVGCTQHPHTPRSETSVGSYTSPKHSISGALPVQEGLSLRPSAAFSGLSWASGRLDSRSRPGDSPGARTVLAASAPLLDDSAAGSVGTRGCPCPGVRDGGGPAPRASSPGSWPPLPHGREYAAREAGVETPLGPHHAPECARSLDVWR
jgi:hypothetical protein